MDPSNLELWKGFFFVEGLFALPPRPISKFLQSMKSEGYVLYLNFKAISGRVFFLF